jgi:hypothetical protein
VPDPTVSALKEQLDALAAARARAQTEARRLASEGAVPAVAELIRRYEHQAATLTTEIGILRASLSGAEARAGDR